MNRQDFSIHYEGSSCNEGENILNQDEDLNIYKTLDSQEVTTNIKVRMPDLEGGRRW
ncbi:MAG: hypothetical protein ACI9CD_001185 [Candidatus Deianiraeaceae bacterium]|jgi:hypothetical protein